MGKIIAILVGCTAAFVAYVGIVELPALRAFLMIGCSVVLFEGAHRLFKNP